MCPACRALISAQAEQCPFCGAAIGAPGFRMATGNSFTDRLIPNGKMAAALLLLVNVALFVGIRMSGTDRLARYGAKFLPAILQGDWYRLITAGYLHTDFMHVFFNMISLYNLAPIVEEIYGTRRMFAIYSAATVMGFVLSSYWLPRSPSLGASAGIFGLLGALVAYGVINKSMMARYLQTQCLTNAGIGFIMGGILPYIDNAAHLGGMIGGFAAAYFAELPRRVDDAREKLWGVVSLVCFLMTAWAFFELVRAMRQ